VIELTFLGFEPPADSLDLAPDIDEGFALPISGIVTCPHCGQKQSFLKKKEHWRTVKAPHLKRAVLLRVRMIYAKCQNPDCIRKSFALPISGIERYQRATQPLISEAVAGVIQDNSTLRRIAQRLSRSFNTTGSKSALCH